MRRPLLRTRYRQCKSSLEVPLPHPTYRHVRHPVFTLGVHRFRRRTTVPTCCLSAGRSAIGACSADAAPEAWSMGRISTTASESFKIQHQLLTGRHVVTHLNLHLSWVLLPSQSRPCKHQGSGIFVVGGVAASGRQPVICRGYPAKIHD